MGTFKRALVTGGAGFIGSHIVDQLIAEDCDVVVLDNLSSGDLSNLEQAKLSGKLTFLKGDINDGELVKKALREVEIVFHEAAFVSVPLSIRQPELARVVNVEGTRSLLQNVANSSVGSFIFASSAAVYGNPSVLPLRTNSATVPISPYGETKLDGERLCLEYHRSIGLGTTVLRYFNVFGPRSLAGGYGSVINKFMEKFVRMESPVITGYGDATRDFIYVKDIASANLLSASTSNAKGKIYNVATGRKVTIKELANLELQLLLGPNRVIPFHYEPREKGDIVDSYADVTDIKRDTGFEARYTLESGLEEYFRFLWPQSLSNSERVLARHK